MKRLLSFSLWFFSTSIAIGMEQQTQYFPMLDLKTICFKKIVNHTRLQEPELSSFLKALNYATSSRMPTELSEELTHQMITSFPLIQELFTSIEKEPTKINNPFNTVTMLHFTPDNNAVLSASHYKSSQLEIWDAVTGKHLKTMKGHTKPISAVAIAPNGQFIISASTNGRARLWNIKEIKKPKVLKKFKMKKPIHAVTFDSNSRRCALLDETAVLLWDLAKEKKEKIEYPYPAKKTSRFAALKFSPDGNYSAFYISNIATPQAIALYDFNDIRHLIHPMAINDFCFSLDNKKLISCADNIIYIWGTTDKHYTKILEDHQTVVIALCLLSGGETFVSYDDTTIRFWDIALEKNIKTIPYNNYIISLHAYPDNTLISHTEYIFDPQDSIASFIDQKRKKLPIIQRRSEALRTDFSSDKKHIACAELGIIRLYHCFKTIIEQALKHPAQALLLQYCASCLKKDKKILLTPAIYKTIFRSFPKVLRHHLHSNLVVEE